MFSPAKIRKIIAKGETGQVEFKSEKEKNIDLDLWGRYVDYVE